MTFLLADGRFRPESPIELGFCEGLNNFTLWMRDNGVSISMQEPIGPYRADFVLRMLGQSPLVVECDGRAYHSSAEQRGRDEARDRYMRGIGLRVHRIAGSSLHWRPTLCARIALKELSGTDSVEDNDGGLADRREEIAAYYGRGGREECGEQPEIDPEDGYSHDDDEED